MPTPTRKTHPTRPRSQNDSHRSDPTPDQFTDASRGERLHKVLANAGLASRRQCEAIITAGRVTINSHRVTTLPCWVDPAIDRIEVDGQPIAKPRRRGNAFVYVVVNKPRRVVSTTHDPEGRPCVTELVKLPTRLYPVGRLDADSSGLMLLTNDGELANRLTHPSYEVPKQYQVSVRGRVTHDDLQDLKKGLYLAHIKRPSASHTRPRPGQPKAGQAKLASMAKVKLLGYSRDKTRGDRTNLAITLKEGQNREIRRLLAKLGHKVRRLERTAIGPIQLKGIALGHWRHLTPIELATLRKATRLTR